MLQKILENIFNNKKFTQCKILRILKIEVFETPDNKIIGKLFSKYKLLFLNQAYSCTDPSQILVLKFLTPSFTASLAISQILP